PRKAAGGYAQDRPLVRRRHDRHGRWHGAGFHHHQPCARAQAQGGGRRRRDRGAIAPAAAAQLRRDAGLPVQQGGPGRGFREPIPGLGPGPGPGMMRLATFLVPDGLDAKQALRLRRFGLAALTYALSTALVAVAWAFGVLPASVALQIAVVFLGLNLVLYASIRSGFNLRFEDPSLTRFQILIAITVLMYIVYNMDDGRNIALFGCFVVFQFGIFRLNSREFTVMTLYTLAAYALVINLLMHLRPQAIQ